MKDDDSKSWQERLGLFQAQVNAYIKLVAEHGIARVAVAGGLAIVSYVLFNFSEADWPASQVFVAGGVVMIAVGAFVRWAEMHYKLLSGRTFVLKCAHYREPLVIEPIEGEKFKPPLLVKCSNAKCKVANLISKYS